VAIFIPVNSQKQTTVEHGSFAQRKALANLRQVNLRQPNLPVLDSLATQPVMYALAGTVAFVVLVTLRRMFLPSRSA